MDFSTHYSKLNAAQKQAVDTIDGPVMVIAGPGTGKTELLSMRVANILQKTDTLPDNILCLTFTDSGAGAMRERLTQIIGADAYKVAIHTFHSFGTEIINQNGEFFYRGADFRPADELSCYELLRTVFDELDYDNPLAGKMNGEYVYLKDTLTAISELKKSGLVSGELLSILDANDAVIDKIESRLSDIFLQRISKTTATQLEPIVTSLHATEESIELPGITSLARIIADSLEIAIETANESGSTKSITAWKNAWLKKNDTGAFILKSRERQSKLRAVSYVYDQYISRMEAAQLYDFDDMILQVVHAMEVHSDLRFNLQEKYLYLMVDEFQDTNLAQMRILHNLTNNEVNAGQPNIMVVGDDDQAIYSFQGADVGNINGFRDTFNQTKIIALKDNYRSASIVLEKARNVITRGTNRLETYLPDLDKTLVPHHTGSGDVKLVEFPTQNDERAWLASTIAEKLRSGAAPNSIAVIARRHHELVALLPYFTKQGININYERRDNVLDLEVIKLIEHISSLVASLFAGHHDQADALLPELLAHPAFGVPAHDVWRLSLQARENQQTWMEVMATTPKFVPLHTWLVELSQMLAHTPLEALLDRIVGLPGEQKGTESEYDDNGERVVSEQPAFVSPLFAYFFSSTALSRTPDTYLTYLEALRTIRSRLRDYQPNDTPTLQSFLEFIRLHRRLGSPITSVRPGSERITDAINLMTAHKSKGLEFDTVYIVGAVDTAWGERVRTRTRLIGYPENLPLAPSGDTLDERLRLFFVAMTRAKSQLFISYSTCDDGGKNMLRASFLTGDEWQPDIRHPHVAIDDLIEAAELAWYQPLVHPLTATMHELLVPTLERYKLSITHLNNFLDVSRGGPQTFLLTNLLRFPQAISPSAGYGSAIHATLQRAHAHLSATKQLRPLEDILQDFEKNLRAVRLDNADFQEYLQKGTDALSRFIEKKYADFRPEQKAELNFAGQSVILGEAHLTGSLDLVDINETERTIIVTDYKTGKALRDWSGKTDYEKIKLHKYKQQLMFYDLLVRHSRDYSKYEFKKGVLQFVEPTPHGDIVALEATFSRSEIEQFSHLIQKVWQHIITLDLPDISMYEPNYKGMLAFEQALLDETS